MTGKTKITKTTSSLFIIVIYNTTQQTFVEYSLTPWAPQRLLKTIADPLHNHRKMVKADVTSTEPWAVS